MKIWQGSCIVHATFPARRAGESASGASQRPWSASHPNVLQDVLAIPTSSLLPGDHPMVASSEADEFIRDDRKWRSQFASELAPHKRFHSFLTKIAIAAMPRI